jgi:hypothetical protein
LAAPSWKIIEFVLFKGHKFSRAPGGKLLPLGMGAPPCHSKTTDGPDPEADGAPVNFFVIDKFSVFDKVSRARIMEIFT